MAGAVVWLTGLSGSGKTSLGEALTFQLERRGVAVEHLDGDSVREVVGNAGFSAEARALHLRYAAFTARLLERHGIVTICSFISPLSEHRSFARSVSQQFVEIFLSTPLPVCEERDPKGLYRRARTGELPGFTGVGSPYEPPLAPDLVLDASVVSLEEEVEEVLKLLRARGIISSGT